MSILARKEYQQAPDLDSLAELLIERGDVEEDASLEEVYETARRDWWDMTRNKDKELSNNSEEIPGYEVETEDGVVHIKGMLHNARDSPENEEVIRTLNNEIAQKSKIGPILLEQKFKDHFLEDRNKEKDSINEMDDTDWAYRYNPHISLTYHIKETLKLPVKGYMMKVAPLINRFSKSIKWDIEDSKNEASTSLKNWGDFLNAMDASRLPLHHEDEYRSKKSHIDNLMEEGRSVYQADMTKYWLEEYSDSKVSVYVGMRHAPQIRDWFELEHSGKLDPASYRSRY